MTSNPHCVVVNFAIRPERTVQFRSAILENARLTLENEEGCTVFDVCVNDEGTEVLLYEIYASKDAFREHLKAAHFVSFDAQTKDWVMTKTVRSYEVISKRGFAA